MNLTSFTSVVITVHPEYNLSLPLTTRDGLHGVFLALVKQRNSSLAGKYHAQERSKPFTISPLYGELYT